MFILLGLGALPAVLAGALLSRITLPELFAGAGLTLAAIALACMGSPALRAIGAVADAARDGPAP